MSNFPTLIPAFTAQVVIDPLNVIGPLATGPALFQIPFKPSSGTVTSHPSYAVKLDADILHGADYIKADPAGSSSSIARLEVQSVIKDKTTGALARFNYTGFVNTAGPAGKVLRGEADAKTTPFGDAFTHVTFETSSASGELAALSNKVFVASGHFILEDGKPTIVEYLISEVAK
ncbi:hypothetical protein B0T17DRAFT_315157 [Bombardia bombarda]|uniref:Uncharacterized protein n=1 Tax=Bombardia bombarda TaxID=252184 RepID=A0AA39WM18_9PEZI|nr:hypothetical protein B0T17DRAFT_315157 [Bombardia bombarda]